MTEYRCPWCGAGTQLYQDERAAPYNAEPRWRWCCYSCSARSPWRPTRDDAMATMADVKPGTMVECALCDGDGLRKVEPGESEVGAGECPACEGKGKLRAEADAAERGAFVVKSALREMELRSRADDLARRLGEAEALRLGYLSAMTAAQEALATERAAIAELRATYDAEVKGYRDDLTALMWHIHQNEQTRKMNVDEALWMYRRYAIGTGA